MHAKNMNHRFWKRIIHYPLLSERKRVELDMLTIMTVPSFGVDVIDQLLALQICDLMKMVSQKYHFPTCS